MQRTMMALAAVAALLGGCAMGGDGGRRGVTGPVKYRNMSCARLDRERVKVEAGTNRLFLSLRRKGVFGKRTEAETLALWPTLMFLKGPNSRDKAQFGGYQRDYELLRRTAREQGCRLVFADDVTRTVRGAGRSPAADRINEVVKEETQR